MFCKFVFISPFPDITCGYQLFGLGKSYLPHKSKASSSQERKRWGLMPKVLLEFLYSFCLESVICNQKGGLLFPLSQSGQVIPPPRTYHLEKKTKCIGISIWTCSVVIHRIKGIAVGSRPWLPTTRLFLTSSCSLLSTCPCLTSFFRTASPAFCKDMLFQLDKSNLKGASFFKMFIERKILFIGPLQVTCLSLDQSTHTEE